MNNLLEQVQSHRAKKTFYPTPLSLMPELFKDIDWRCVESILEPSAGKGDLAMYIAEKMYTVRRGRNVYDERCRKEAVDYASIDCIEIDPALRDVLDGKGFRVIHDDFLTFETQKRYSLIAMNPPFDEGARHLLKALELQERGGSVVCILNAETIRNPCFEERRQLMKKLNEYSANVRYKTGAFADAERRTDVEVALVEVSIPQANTDSSIMDEMRKVPTYKAQKISPDYADLVRYDAIEKFVNQYNFEVACGIRLMEEWFSMRETLNWNDDGLTKDLIMVKIRGEDRRDKDANINWYIAAVREKYWSIIFHQKSVVGKLTGNLVSELYDMVHKLRDYEFSAYNILTLIIKMNKRIGEGIEATILSLFDDWTGRYHWSDTTANRHYYDGWKTNDCFRVGKKVIVPFYGAFNSWSGRMDTYKIKGTFGDIEKVFEYLDCGYTTDAVDSIAQIEKAAANGENRNIDTKFFVVTLYKKGTAHFVFKDMDLLEKFNLFAGRKKGWLPPSYGKKRYNDMNEEEQHVIDSFQGKERYAEIIAKADYFLGDGSSQLMLGSGVGNGGRA